ncbi:COP9 signalosome complex subunit 7b-like [Myripristis murdjan]|uniref:COP9 signalosome complex subunit 7b-like n=1 Tax=Myripristis murdjan TaxID=586833 RepID=UPI0011763536|nr:COP9 signalosome complex subunit 7b-like [Myripristis murdjan]
MAGEHEQSSHCEQSLSLAEETTDESLVSLINQLLAAPGVSDFGEFLDLSCVQELSGGPDEGYLHLLTIFAYGTYHDYKALKNTLPPLNEIQKNKLRHLSIVNLAANVQVIPYSVLMKDLDLVSVRQLEDLLIEAMYAGVIQGKLDQCRQQLEVDFCISRDIPYEGIVKISSILTQWCSNCETVLTSIPQQVGRMNECKDAHLKAHQEIEAEVRNIHQQILFSSSTSHHSLHSQRKMLLPSPTRGQQPAN